MKNPLAIVTKKCENVNHFHLFLNYILTNLETRLIKASKKSLVVKYKELV